MNKIDRKVRAMRKELKRVRKLQTNRYNSGKKRPAPRAEYRKVAASKAYSLVHFVWSEDLLSQFKSYCYNNMPASLPSEKANPFNLAIRILENSMVHTDLNITQSSSLERWGKGLIYAFTNGVNEDEFEHYLQRNGITKLFKQYQGDTMQSNTGAAKRREVRTRKRWEKRRDSFLKAWLDT